VTGLPFCSPGEAPATSPLAHALAGSRGIDDLSLLGKIEVRGVDVDTLDLGDEEIIRLTPARALLICPDERRDALQRSLPGVTIDMTAAYAGIGVAGETLLRRLTDLDLDALPAAGKVAGVPALVTRSGSTYRIWFAQEHGDSVVELVRDLQEGIA
jgi:hypothetical protein